MATTRKVETLPDGSIDTSQDFGNLFDDVLDDLHRNPSLARATGAPDRMTLDEAHREEQLYFAAVLHEVNDRLRGQGLTVLRVYDDRTDGCTFSVDIRENTGRHFRTSVTVEQLNELGARYGEQMGRHIIELLCEEAISARKRYFARMM